MKLGIIDTNNIGLSFGLLCEKNGFEVLLSNSNEDYVFNLNQKICITDEPLIQSLLFDCVKFSATTSNLEVIRESDIIFVFSDTPINLEGNYDTTNVFNVLTNFYTLSSQDVPLYEKKLVICSTTNPGEMEQIQTRLNMFNIQVAYNPLFVEHGNIVKSLQESDMVLIGCEYQDLSNELIHIHSKIRKVTVNAYVMSHKASEIVKLSINTFISSKINQANMVGQMAIKSGIENEIGMILTAIGGFDGIGKKYLSYGFGFGGPIINGDNKALKHYINNIGLEPTIINTNDDFNEKQLNFIKEYYIQKNPTGNLPFIFNHLTYKKGINVLEESQQFKLCVDLLDNGFNVNVIESPQIMSELNELSEKYEGRLQFYKPGTNPSGILINL